MSKILVTGFDPFGGEPVNPHSRQSSCCRMKSPVRQW